MATTKLFEKRLTGEGEDSDTDWRKLLKELVEEEWVGAIQVILYN